MLIGISVLHPKACSSAQILALKYKGLLYSTKSSSTAQRQALKHKRLFYSTNVCSTAQRKVHSSGASSTAQKLVLQHRHALNHKDVLYSTKACSTAQRLALHLKGLLYSTVASISALLFFSYL